ncbi:MAG: hypothetical protein E7Z89_08490 [Cyanobacteria bacterium SIG28]|nr:hypothetical protein [Cyanobacteria bacterium SIG28]
MGMAASQSRYLALTARKTNTEYEGQQINQARTALANQSANLFNRLLDLEVPVAPKTTDYTEVQYSYTDGINESVLESWQQLSSADPSYNYIVNHYYYADVYTGARKLLENPQVTEKKDLLSERINDRDPLPVVTYERDATGRITSVIIEGANGTVQKSIYTPISSQRMDTKLENSLRDFEEAVGLAQTDGVLSTDNVYGWQDSTGTWHFMLQEDIDKTDPVDYVTQYAPGFVGNCELTELANFTDDQAAALAQILRDCPESNMSQYLSFNDERELLYDGKGIYTFQMNGQTYFTNKTDLYNSMQTYDEYNKPIENQERLAYYNANYIRTKIEETNKALIETDENGRFKSVRFDDDSVIYSLNTETVTDDAAYQDAMNEYNYKVQQYEKTIADINAKTSIIQEEDRTLELRLKQLDTEQKALATEMEAVQKVIKDNVEKTFKTFSD